MKLQHDDVNDELEENWKVSKSNRLRESSQKNSPGAGSRPDNSDALFRKRKNKNKQTFINKRRRAKENYE